MTNLIFEAVKICDPHSAHHGQHQHLLIENGIIKTISDQPILNANYPRISAAHLTLSPAWTDLQAFNGETGYEHKETLTTLSKSALYGGFARVAILPNTNPVADSKNMITYLKNQSKLLPIELLPIGAISKNAEGKDISEAFDLHQAGAIAFSDGLTESNDPKLLKNALQYLQHFDGQLMITPDEPVFSEHGQMNEGIQSVRLGMIGMPNIAEKIAIQRALETLRYTGGKLHLSKISTTEGVALIRQAKAQKLHVTADTEAYRFAFTDADLTSFDTNLKIKPPFRTQADINALLEGIKDGTIDAIISAHIPHDTECKKLEFNLADFGIIGLETAFASLRTFTDLNTSQIIENLAIKPAKILKLAVPKIAENEIANLTLFDENLEYQFTEKHIKSKSKNTPFVGMKLKGKVRGVFTKGQFFEVE